MNPEFSGEILKNPLIHNFMNIRPAASELLQKEWKKSWPL
jgi:hypothetical protein